MLSLKTVDQLVPQGWYGKAVNYWGQIDATVDGVLGGFGHVTGVDLKESQQFLIHLTEKGHLKLSDDTMYHPLYPQTQAGRDIMTFLCRCILFEDVTQQSVDLTSYRGVAEQ